ncbi:metallophosphoesterase [Mucisphaera calidilacus]|uniref:Phosphoesterase n=1 Tax=Mucisphaera calidilacus TaxID=2527982 RepID=A0A518BZD5_9BACT|nr:metallophosphoesterase [Mucisphaera calidilacus]QDU72336.1 phosphodiesterase [Mucisphaera calidilacus]
MRIGVISDTHDRIPTFQRAMSMFRQLKVDAILHAGDFVAPFAARLLLPEYSRMPDTPVHCVLGNNDGERAGLQKMLPQLVNGPLTLTLAGKTVVMHHFIDWLKPADIAKADVVITGHTHEIVNETVDHNDKPQLRLNPGECCGWLTDRCTVALLDLDKQEAEIVEVHP